MRRKEMHWNVVEYHPPSQKNGLLMQILARRRRTQACKFFFFSFVIMLSASTKHTLDVKVTRTSNPCVGYSLYVLYFPAAKERKTSSDSFSLRIANRLLSVELTSARHFGVAFSFLSLFSPSFFSLLSCIERRERRKGAGRCDDEWQILLTQAEAFINGSSEKKNLELRWKNNI